MKWAALLMCLVGTPSSAGMLEWPDKFARLDCTGFVDPRGRSSTSVNITRHDPNWMRVYYNLVIYSTSSHHNTKEIKFFPNDVTLKSVELEKYKYLKRDPMTYIVRVTCTAACGTGSAEEDGEVYENQKETAFIACATLDYASALQAVSFFEALGAEVFTVE
ncbi:hypothetical protein [Rhizobium leguminosarum]|uniref:hypothetical protein n=1 Tax=Rhizobium leguminosarum TaxID=384 RepID=UPI00103B1650|nr:hypothetical protein [Rhizobium leguminosarum]TBY80638.1 hypothetical protein E0H32_19745 [Rhizobium leguminosarum bv. viciae]